VIHGRVSVAACCGLTSCRVPADRLAAAAAAAAASSAGWSLRPYCWCGLEARRGFPACRAGRALASCPVDDRWSMVAAAVSCPASWWDCL